MGHNGKLKRLHTHDTIGTVGLDTLDSLALYVGWVQMQSGYGFNLAGVQQLRA